jgi:hypothetical protein
MLDPASITTIIMASLSIIGVTLNQTKHCKSGCFECEKVALEKKDSEIKIKEYETIKKL